MKKVILLLLIVLTGTLWANSIVLKSGKYTVIFSEEQAWTIQKILYNEKEYVNDDGSMGTVINKSGLFLGSGHTEGGKEDVKNVKLTIDDKVVQINPAGEIYTGKQLILEKLSFLDKLKSISRTIITADGIEESYEYEAVEPQTIERMYVFMHSFTPDTTDWIANDGKQAFGGKFESNGSWKLQKDVKYLALYCANDKVGMAIIFPKVYPGIATKSGLWDLKLSHRYYLQPYDKIDIATGTCKSWSMKLKFFESNEADWINKAVSLDEKIIVPAKIATSKLNANEIVCGDMLDDITFYQSFENGINARFANGNPRGQLINTDKINLVDKGFRSKAIAVGDSFGGISYESENNLNYRRGSLSFWFKPLNWDCDTKESVVLFRTDNIGKSYMLIFKQGGSDALSFYLKTANNDQYLTSYPSDNWKTDEWHHVALSWINNEYTFFLDGREGKKTVVPRDIKIDDLSDYFIIGNCTNSKFQSLIDEFIVLNRPLADGEAAKIYQSYTGRDKQKAQSDKKINFMALPVNNQVPVIDGVWDEKEWNNANQLTGFSLCSTNGGFIPNERQTWVWITTDGKKLYLAFRSQVPEGHVLRKAVDHRDGQVYLDDAIELMIQSNSKEQEVFQFAGNSIGNIFDGVYSDNKLDLKWNGNWEFKNSVKDGWWTAELAISLIELNIDITKNFKMRFCRDCQDPQLFSCLPPSRSETYDNRDTMLNVKIDPLAPVIKIVDSSAILGKGTIGMDMAALNSTGNKSSELITELEILGLGKIIGLKREKLNIPGSIAIRDTLPEALQDTVRLKVADQEKNEYLNLEFSANDSGLKINRQASMKRAFWFDAKLYPTYQKLNIELDFSNLKEADKVKSLKFTLKDNNGKIIKQKSVSCSKSSDISEALELNDISIGDYQFEASLLDGNDNVIKSEKDLVRILAKPEWLGAKLGVSNKIQPPFTPLEYEKNTISMWGRKYSFADTLLPEKIITNGAEILAAPIVFTCQSTNGIETFIANKLVYNERKPEQAVINNILATKNGQLKINMRATVEYDGLIFYEFTLEPIKEIELTKLSMEIPLTQIVGRFLHYVGDSGTINSDAMQVPDGNGCIWDSAKVPKVQTKSTFIPYLHIGNKEQGLAFFSDTYRSWVENGKTSALEIFRENNQVKLKINFISGKTKIVQNKTFSFGLMATPVKPLPTDWRAWDFQQIFDQRDPANCRILWPNYYIIPCRMSLTSQDDASVRKAVAQDHARGVKVLPYIDITATGKNVPEYRYFKHEWTLLPISEVTCEKSKVYKINSDNPDDHTYIRTELQDSFVDYLLYSIKNMIEKWDIDGVYFDQVYPIANMNTQTQSAYWENGKMHPVFRIMAMRDFTRRVGALFRSYGKAPIILEHMSATMVIPSFSFAHVALDGEQLRSHIDGVYGHEKLFTPGKIFGEFYAKNYGLIPLILPEFTGDKEESRMSTRNLLAITMLHDMLIWEINSNYAEINLTYQVKKAFGIADRNVEFSPYWQNGNDGDLKATMYLKKYSSALIVAGNLTDRDIEGVVKLDFARLGFNAKEAKAINAVSKNNLILDGAGVKVTVPKHDFVMILIEKDK